MAQFIIRPELNGGTSPDWELLHDALYERNIFRVIKLNDGYWYDLPRGTYQGIGELTSQAVYNLVVSALNEIGKTNIGRRDYELYVAKTSGSYNDLTRNIDNSKLPPEAQ